MSRYASRFNKRDKNEPEIKAALAQMGIDWHESGPLDGWVWIQGWVPVEIKTKNGTLTQGQREFVAWCRDKNAEYMVVRSVDDLLDQVTAYRKSLQ